MLNAQEVRDGIVEELRRELLGPAPGFPAMQMDREEILRPQDPPRLRYATGVLFPQRTAVPTQVAATEDLIDGSEVASIGVADEGSEAEPMDEAGTGRGESRTESQPETDADLNLANQYLPSAMGMSVLIDLPERMLATARAAQYRKQELPGITKGSGKGVAWCRRPLSAEIVLDRSDLAGAGVVTIEKPVLTAGTPVRLGLHVVSRPYRIEGGSPWLRLMTVTLINRNTASTASNDELCFFQCRFELSCADGSACFLEYPDRRVAPESEDRWLQFLYRHKKVYAVGHGCAGEWAQDQGGRCARVWTETLPQYEVKPIEHVELENLQLSMMELAQENSSEAIALCDALAAAYEGWIAAQEIRAADPKELPARFRDMADTNLQHCKSCLQRVRRGIDLLKTVPELRKAFALANQAMYMQQAHYELATRSVRAWAYRDGKLQLPKRYEVPDYEQKSSRWRPFQLAFLLMNLESVANPDSPGREIVDLIWFPTGGGKTEAYLGLSAFVIMLRRLRDPQNAGTAVLMRYTLRLLTTQQFQRAASLICACEFIRRRNPERLGSTSISIGLWVGQGVTPNRHEEATRALNELLKGGRENPFIVLACPWCGAQMGAVKAGNSWRVKGYLKKTKPSRVDFCCEDPDCAFGAPAGLPLHVVDEAIYNYPPTLIIGTVDKFAMLPWRPEARSLFGLEHGWGPPELIVQDELHLISGPLGSMVAHYETAIEALCRAQDGSCAPKIVASTATIARAAEQVRALYNGRPCFLFPPQGLQIGESFFAKENAGGTGRRYIGVFASALPSHVTAQIRVLAALLQAVKTLPVSDPALIDPYWTLMVYFNSIRELGHAATLIRADIREYMNAMWDRQGLKKVLGGEEALQKRRFINRDLELTSRVQSSQVPEILQQLFHTMLSGESQSAVDVCLATNMIQVGLDVLRLSLMAIIGQPKTTAEYIQASSRIGRRDPGLVVTIYNPSRPRDRSHYEHFHAYHQSLYQYVEPTSITPFAEPVTERALHAVAVALVRILGGEALRNLPNSPPPDNGIIRAISSIISDRVSNVDSQQAGAVSDRLAALFTEWRRVPPAKYGDFGPPDEEEPLMYPSGSVRHDAWSVRTLPTPSSMRNVDATCDVAAISNYPEAE